MTFFDLVLNNGLVQLLLCLVAAGVITWRIRAHSLKGRCDALMRRVERARSKQELVNIYGDLTRLLLEYDVSDALELEEAIMSMMRAREEQIKHGDTK